MSPEAHPTRGQQRCMIYRRPARKVETACINCGLSLIACQSQREYDGAACCETDNHPPSDSSD